jgi:hypothetical protein
LSRNPFLLLLDYRPLAWIDELRVVDGARQLVLIGRRPVGRLIRPLFLWRDGYMRRFLGNGSP